MFDTQMLARANEAPRLTLRVRQDLSIVLATTALVVTLCALVTMATCHLAPRGIACAMLIVVMASSVAGYAGRLRKGLRS